MMAMAQRHKLVNSYTMLMRLNRPVGIWLLMWPCWWGLVLASQNALPWHLLLLFALGAIIMRSAGCIINDLADRHFDAQVARTKTRPLASGEISPYQAIMLLASLLSLALLIVCSLHPNLFYWATGSLLLVGAYPFMKRITWWPQLFLGLTFNLGALFGWIAIYGEPALPAWLLYLAGIAWTVGYDTIYGHQDIEDDLQIGIKSTAILFGQHTKLLVGLWYSITVVALLACGYLMQYSMLYYMGIIACAIQLIWQVVSVRLDQPQHCLRAFKSNQWVGGIVFLTIAAEIL